VNRATYLQTQQQLRLLAQIVREMPLKDFINAAEHAETLGPLIDPTLYAQGSRNLAKVKYLAQALLPFAQVVEKFSLEKDQVGPDKTLLAQIL